MSSFCGATDTPVSDFWWCLLWVSKPEWVLPYSSLAEAYVLHYTFPEIHLWCNTCWPLGGQHGSRAVSCTYLRGIGGTRNRELSCRRSQCEIRPHLLPNPSAPQFLQLDLQLRSHIAKFSPSPIFSPSLFSIVSMVTGWMGLSPIMDWITDRYF